MILLIQINNHSFHYLEFVKPVEDILTDINIKFKSVHYKEISSQQISRSKKIIILGTSLKDNSFLKDIDRFKWILEYNNPILGICGGMHILELLYDGILKKQQEIGLNEVDFHKSFLGFIGARDVYELHNYFVESSEYLIFATSNNCPQATKHKNKDFFGVLFHPEVRNKNLIVNFVNQNF